jgi:hypothetical protein
MSGAEKTNPTGRILLSKYPENVKMATSYIEKE